MPAGRPRIIRADNPGPLTLDGTRTYLVGRDPVAVIDPGPDLPDHIDAVADQIGGGVSVVVLPTHDHADHAAAAAPLVERLKGAGARVRHVRARDGERFDTDGGELVAVATPGHTPEHVAFHWRDAGAVFVGDLMLGGSDSTMVAPPEGDLVEYLASLRRVAGLNASALYPAHGPFFANPRAGIERYLRHRQERLDAVRAAMGAGAGSEEAIMERVYGGELDPRLRPAALGAVRAYLDYLEREGP